MQKSETLPAYQRVRSLTKKMVEQNTCILNEKKEIQTFLALLTWSQKKWTVKKSIAHDGRCHGRQIRSEWTPPELMFIPGVLLVHTVISSSYLYTCFAIMRVIGRLVGWLAIRSTWSSSRYVSFIISYGPSLMLLSQPRLMISIVPKPSLHIPHPPKVFGFYRECSTNNN